MEEITEYLLNKSRKKLNGALNTIAKRIVDKECSLFVGSGMSLNSNLPSWHQLLTPCADELEIPIHPYSDLFSLAQYYANCKSDSELRRIVNDQIDLLAKPTPLHDKLVMAGFKSIWTTNYDMLIEDSLRNDHIAFNTIISDSDLAKVSYEGRINVYKINGDTNNRNAMVLTQRDIESYTKTHQLFLTFLKKELVSNTFLFVGYSFTDRIILNCLCEIREYLNLPISNTTIHYAIMVVNGSEDQNSIYFAEDLKLRYGIECIFIKKEDLSNIVALLWKKIQTGKVFISGSYNTLSDEEEHFADSLSEHIVRNLYDNNYRISTGIGKRLGAFITGYANQYLITKGMTNISKFLSMRPFPFHLNLDENKKATYRMIMQHDCYAAIFMFGRSETTTKEGSYETTGHYSHGVYQEFEIAKESGRIIIPIGSTGYEAKVIWNEVKNNINEYPYLSKKIDILGCEKDPERLSKIILSILDDNTKHHSINQ
jgi:hypothetical protein